MATCCGCARIGRWPALRWWWWREMNKRSSAIGILVERWRTRVFRGGNSNREDQCPCGLSSHSLPLIFQADLLPFISSGGNRHSNKTPSSECERASCAVVCLFLAQCKSCTKISTSLFLYCHLFDLLSS